MAVCADPDEISKFDKIVLPGVGSSKTAMEGLEQERLIDPLLDQIKKGKPFLGICLGLQLLFTRSEESGGCDCLGIVPGQVKLFTSGKVPQIGWNTVKILKKDCPVFKGVKDGTYFYFVHSYYCRAENPEYVAGVTEYGTSYISALWKDNIFALQFHPERSQADGLKILENFVKL